MQLTVQQPDLSQMFGQDSLYSTLYGLQRQDQANANNAQNLGQAQQDQQFQADQHPLDMGLLQSQIGHTDALTGLTNAQIPGMQADSNTKVRNDADEAAVPQDQRRQALISKIAAGTTEDDLKKHVAQATMDLTATNPDGTPDVGRRRDAQLVISSAPALQAELAKVKAMGDNAARVAGIEAGSREKVEQMQEDAGKYNKYKLDFMMKTAQAKANFQQQASIAQAQADDAQSQVDKATDPDEKAYLQDKVSQFLKQKQEAVFNDYRAKQAAGMGANAGKLDVGAAAGMPNVVNVNSLPVPPVNPTPQPTPQAAPIKSGPTPGTKVMHGGVMYMFKGGDPSNQSNWEKQ